MILLLVPFIYMGICATMSAILPPVDYKIINQQSQVQSPQTKPTEKSPNQIPEPAQDPRSKDQI